MLRQILLLRRRKRGELLRSGCDRDQQAAKKQGQSSQNMSLTHRVFSPPRMHLLLQLEQIQRLSF
jgi:hypothetical protein